MVTSETCRSCQTIAGALLVLEFFQTRFIQAHPEIGTLSRNVTYGGLDIEVVQEAAQQFADVRDSTALDFTLVFDLLNVVGEEEDCCCPHKQEKPENE